MGLLNFPNIIQVTLGQGFQGVNPADLNENDVILLRRPSDTGQAYYEVPDGSTPATTSPSANNRLKVEFQGNSPSCEVKCFMASFGTTWSQFGRGASTGTVGNNDTLAILSLSGYGVFQSLSGDNYPFRALAFANGVIPTRIRLNATTSGTGGLRSFWRCYTTGRNFSYGSTYYQGYQTGQNPPYSFLKWYGRYADSYWRTAVFKTMEAYVAPAPSREPDKTTYHHG